MSSQLPEPFLGKVALITGAAQGIGRDIAIGFAHRGCRVIVADLNQDAGRRTAAEIGGDFVPLDVGDEAEVGRTVKGLVSRFGGLDFAVNNAGILGPLKPLWEYSESEFDRLVRVNLDGCWYCLKHEVAAMLSGSGGCIVNVSSINGLRGMACCAVYSATKAAVLGLTRTAAREYAHRNIRINAVCPGGILGGLMQNEASEVVAAAAAARAGVPREVADTVVWLCSPEASYIHGEEVRIDGGLLT